MAIIAVPVLVPGNHDADTSTERAVFRDGAWYVEGQAPVFFGLDGDVPVPLPSAVYRNFLLASSGEGSPVGVAGCGYPPTSRWP